MSLVLREVLDDEIELPNGEIARDARGLRGLVEAYQPADSDGQLVAKGVQVVELDGSRIAAIHAFLDPRLVNQFGLPQTLQR